MRFVLFTFLILLTCAGVRAQDVIYKKDNTKIDCKVVEVGTTAVKYSLTEGEPPFIDLAKSEILVVQYANGDHEIFEIRSLGNVKVAEEFEFARNTISFNFLDIIFLRMQMSYEHINKEGNIGFRVPLTLGMYENELTYFSGIDLNLYPMGQKRVSYFLGPKFRAGYINDYIFLGEDFVAIMFNNGIKATITPNFILSVNVSVGAAHTYDYGRTVPMGSLSLLLGFKV